MKAYPDVSSDTASPTLSVAMPAFNEKPQIAASVLSVVAALEATGESWELVVINDGSADGTGAIVGEIASRDSRVRVVHHPSNLGIGRAIASGVATARGKWFMIIPADLAMDLRDIGRYLGGREGAAVVAGYTANRPDYSAWRHVVSWLNRTAVARLVGVNVRCPNYIHLFRIDAISGPPFRFTGSAAIYAEMLRRASSHGRIVEVPITYVPRLLGKQTGANWSLIAKTARDLVRLRLGI
jgi:glycosyltransferase involved in cell wall biosynthesis